MLAHSLNHSKFNAYSTNAHMCTHTTCTHTNTHTHTHNIHACTHTHTDAYTHTHTQHTHTVLYQGSGTQEGENITFNIAGVHPHPERAVGGGQAAAGAAVAGLRLQLLHLSPGHRAPSLPGSQAERRGVSIMMVMRITLL